MGSMIDDPGRGITRRRFVTTVSTAAVAAALSPALAAKETVGRARVVLVRDADVLDDAGKPRADVIQRMLDRGMCELFRVERPVEAWKKALGPAKTVGIKTNAWKYLSTPPEVEGALKRRIVEAGVPEGSVRIDDRGARQTLASCDALVNARPLRTHHWAGIGGCLKNPIMFAEEPSFYHPDLCADLGALWTLPTLKDKVKLNVLVVLTPQFLTRGPNHFDPRYVWPYRGILISTDPVAVDAVGVRLLEAKRKLVLAEERPLAELAHHVRIAGEKHKLGVADPARIDLIKVGWEKDALV
jgi:hypothetical protein